MALAVSVLGCSTAHAATFGHARIVSSLGQPLIIMVPVSGLSAADAQSLSAQAAVAADWTQAGLTPPVALDSLHIAVEQGVRPEGRVLRISSSQVFSGPLADLLLDVRSASGMQRYQVSLLTGGRAPAASPMTGGAGSTQGSAVGAPQAQGHAVPSAAIAVRPGDFMFAIARRHAVSGVTVYQMMMALQRANPQAFIHQNVNLVKAGTQLTMPGMDELLAISDREARRQFQIQSAAFAAMRGSLATELTAAIQSGTPSQGQVSQATPSVIKPAPEAGRGDHLQLSDAAGAQQDAAADTRTATQHATTDAQGRVSQLEDNVQHLNEALQAQGEAARSAVVDGAKGIGDSIASVAQAITEAGKAEEADAATPQSSTQTSQVLGSGTQSPAGATGSVAAPVGSGGIAVVGSGNAQAGNAQTGNTETGNTETGNAQAGSAQTGTGQANNVVSGTGAPASAASGADGHQAAVPAAASGATADAGAPSAPGSAGAAAASTKPGAAAGNGALTGQAQQAGAAPSDGSGAASLTASPGSQTSAGGTGSSSGQGLAASTASTANTASTSNQSAAGTDLSGAAATLGGQAPAEAAARAAQTEAQAAERSQGIVAWLQDHLLMVMTGLLALIVFIVAWLLRRASSTRDEAYDAAQATEAMVREKLKDIDLDLKPQKPEHDEVPAKE